MYCAGGRVYTDGLSMTSWKHRGNGDASLYTLNLATRWMWLVTFTPHLLFRTSVIRNSDVLLQRWKFYIFCRAHKGSRQNLKMRNCVSSFALTIGTVCKRLRLLCHFAVLISKVYLTTLGRSAYTVFVRKPEGKPPLRRPRNGWVYNIKVSLKSQCLLYILPGLTFRKSVFYPQSVLMRFVWISKKNGDYLSM